MGNSIHQVGEALDGRGMLRNKSSDDPSPLVAAARPDQGGIKGSSVTTSILPLPPTYSFLEEVFRSTDTIAAMLHNRQEVITVEKLKKGVETMTRKNFQLDFLKRIRTLFPSAYLYIWEQMVGKYGKKLNEYELRIGVNMDFR